MSINPVQRTEPDVTSSAELRPNPASLRVPASPGDRVSSDSGPAPKTERPSPPETSAPQEIPQDEVQVQRGGEANSEIVIRYLDGRGDLILQVPSAQVLAVARSIAQDFAGRAKSSSDEPAERPSNVRKEN